MSDDLSAFANSNQGLPSRLTRVRDGFTRNEVVTAFQSAFDLIGGVDRLTLWAHENPSDFYRLYAKLLPATTVQLGQEGKYIIEHALAATALDRQVIQNSQGMRVIDVTVELNADN